MTRPRASANNEAALIALQIMITLRKIESGLFPDLYEQFLIDDDPLSDEQDWRNVFDYQFENEEGYCGYAMLDGREVIGMLGMVFSIRIIGGKQRKFCNLHTWWVREDHRGRSLALLRPILKLDGYTITHFTPCDTVRAVTKRLGFEDLDSQLRILLPDPVGRKRVSDKSSLIYDPQVIEGELGQRDRRIALDHLPYGVGHLLVRHGDASCYILYTYVVRHRLPYCHIHYIGDRDVFASVEGTVRASLLKRHRASFVALDNRLADGFRLPLSFNFWAPAHALYKSSDLCPQQIDNLYSDVVFLKLTTLPHLSYELGQFVRRCRQFVGIGDVEPRAAV